MERYVRLAVLFLLSVISLNAQILVPIPVPAGGGGGSIIIGNPTFSQDDTTIVATWTTTVSANGSMICGAKNGSDNGLWPNATSHLGIVTGLSPGTVYSCTVTSGASTSTPQNITTNSAHVSTSVNQIALGSTITTGNHGGDFSTTFVSNNGHQYITEDDGYGFAVTANAGANMQVGDLTSPSTLTGTLVNLLTAYGPFNTFNGTDGPGGIPQSNKLSGGIFGMGGSLYLFQHRQSEYSNPNPNEVFGNIMRSNDYGATWNSWQAPSVFNAAGIPPVPLGSYQFPSPNVGYTKAIRYAQDDGTIGYLTAGNRIDGANGFVYFYFPLNGSVATTYLMRAPRIAVEQQLTTNFQFWAGPTPASVTPAAFVNDSNWSTSIGSATSVSCPGANYDRAIEFIPGLNRYVQESTTFPGNTGLWLMFDEVTPAGPCTLVAQQNNALAGWYSENALHSSEIGNSALSNVNLTLVYSGVSSTSVYGPHSSSMILNPTSSPNMQQLVSYACTTIENPVSDGGNISTVTGVLTGAHIQGVSGNLCEPAAINEGALAVYTAPPVAGDTGAPWPPDQCSDIYIYGLNTTGYFGPGVRMTTSSTGYVAAFGSTGSSNVALYKITSGGTLTMIGGGGVTASVTAGDSWRLCAVGTNLTLYQNALGLALGFTPILGPISDSTYSSGNPGWVQEATSAVTDSQLGSFDALANQASSPTFSPATSGFSGTVTITSATSGATIYYTTNGTQPTRSSSTISNGGTITVTSPETVKAMAAFTDLADSPVTTVAY